MSPAVTGPSLCFSMRSDPGLGVVHLDEHVLQVEDDVGDVLDDIRQGLELVKSAVDLDRT